MAGEQLVSPFVLEYAYKRSVGPVISRFLTGLRAARIEGVRTASGRVLVPPSEYDPQTGESVEDWVSVGPGGTVTSWSWVEAPGPRHPRDTPFAWGLVKLDGADTAMLHILDVPKDALVTGMRVEPRWRDDRVGSVRDIDAFVPEGTAPEATVLGEGEPVTGFKSPTRLEYIVTAGSVTADFLRGILKKELIAKRCPSCSKVYLPPRGSCPLCGVPTTTPVPVAQTGTVTTFSVIRIPFEGQVLEPPYACAHILIDGTDTPLLHIVGDVDVDTVRMGMRVEAVWAETIEPTFASVRYFRPIDEPDVPYAQLREHV